MFKVNNTNTRTTSMTSFWCFYCLFLVFLLLTLNKEMLAGYVLSRFLPNYESMNGLMVISKFTKKYHCQTIQSSERKYDNYDAECSNHHPSNHHKVPNIKVDSKSERVDAKEILNAIMQ